MSTPTAMALPARVPNCTAPPPLVHSSCVVCTDPEYAFCGHKYTKVLPESEWPETPTTCVVCAELSDAHDWAAHLGWQL